MPGSPRPLPWDGPITTGVNVGAAPAPLLLSPTPVATTAATARKTGTIERSRRFIGPPVRRTGAIPKGRDVENGGFRRRLSSFLLSGRAGLQDHQRDLPLGAGLVLAVALVGGDHAGPELGPLVRRCRA